MLVTQVTFLQGDDATEIFNIMYPVGKTGGSDKTMRNAIDRLREHDKGETDRVQELDTYPASGTFRTRDYVLTWNYAYNWIALYRKVYKRHLVPA